MLDTYSHSVILLQGFEEETSKQTKILKAASYNIGTSASDEDMMQPEQELVFENFNGQIQQTIHQKCQFNIINSSHNLMPKLV